ncbi:Hypothetical protein A7982_11054 [Minicystis rosea]|nr:Hypothetical protein A7982_11054 [Minicystis rosea]
MTLAPAKGYAGTEVQKPPCLVVLSMREAHVPELGSLHASHGDDARERSARMSKVDASRGDDARTIAARVSKLDPSRADRRFAEIEAA